MTDNLHVDLTEHQRDLLLRGLRFVRSSLVLEQRDPDEALDAKRDEELQQIRDLVDQLNGRTTAGASV